MIATITGRWGPRSKDGLEAGNSLSFCGREPGQLWIGASFHVCLCIDCVRIPLLYSFPGRSSSRKRSAKNSWAYRPGKNLYLWKPATACGLLVWRTFYMPCMAIFSSALWLIIVVRIASTCRWRSSRYGSFGCFSSQASRLANCSWLEMSSKRQFVWFSPCRCSIAFLYSPDLKRSKPSRNQVLNR